MSDEQKPRTQVLRWQGQAWAVGLRWEEKTKSVRRPRARVKHTGTFSVTLTPGQRQTKRLLPQGARQASLLTAQGRIKNSWRHQKVYSLAALFSLRSSPDGYGIYQLDNGQLVFLATVNGMPSLMADVTGEPDHIARALTLFLSFNHEPAHGWQVLSTVAAPQSWEVLVQSATPSELQFARLSGASNVLQVCAAGGLAAALLGGVVWWSLPADTPPVTETVPENRQEQVKDIAPKTPAPVYLPHPWASMPTATHFLNRCQRWRAAVPVSLDLWRLDRVSCRAKGLAMVYQRLPGGSAARFAERVKQVFNRSPVFNLVSGGNDGMVFIPWANFTLQDETAPDAGTQLMQAVSWFQSRQVSFSLSEVKVPPVMPGEGASNDAPQPIQDWDEYTFSITEKHSPEWVLQGLDMQGVRLSSVAYTLSPQGQFTYQIEGHLYAKNAKK
ncbi:type 4b pilus protein PilO2 [Salmonella enterica subsp. enterica serovar Muenchen]|nr:type 4b pilus protein PilO2 [Salmonella enterica subsp. enterica serovar Muenchen]